MKKVFEVLIDVHEWVYEYYRKQYLKSKILLSPFYPHQALFGQLLQDTEHFLFLKFSRNLYRVSQPFLRPLTQ